MDDPPVARQEGCGEGWLVRWTQKLTAELHGHSPAGPVQGLGPRQRQRVAQGPWTRSCAVTTVEGPPPRALGPGLLRLSTGWASQGPIPHPNPGSRPWHGKTTQPLWAASGCGSSQGAHAGPRGAGEPLGQPPGAWRGSRVLPLEQSKAHCSGRWKPPGGAGESSLAAVAMSHWWAGGPESPGLSPTSALGLCGQVTCREEG